MKPNLSKRNVFIGSLVILVVLMLNAFSQTQRITGEKITGTRNWAGTIVIAGDVVIEDSGRLTIESGTKVIFEQNNDLSKSGLDKTRSELIVKGTLIARGMPGKRITFSSQSASPRMGDWYGIVFLHLKSGSILDYCLIEYAYNGITIKNSTMQVSNSEIHYNYHAGIKTEVKAKPIIKNNIISDNGYAGLICELGSKPIITENLISLNRIGVVVFSLSQPNFGSLVRDENYNPGKNKIFNNEEYNFYNHSNKAISAENNAWGDKKLTDIALKLYDKTDNTKFGRIDYTPVLNESAQPKLGNMLLLTQNTTKSPASDNKNVNNNIARNNPQKKPAIVQQQEVEKDTSTKIIVDTAPDKKENTEADEFDLSKKLQEAAPLIASNSPYSIIVNDLPVSNAAIAQQIDYDQTFLELFLDGGKKVYLKKPKLKINSVIKSIMQSGEVRVRIIVGKKGDVEQASLLRGINEILDQAVLEVIKNYKYKPGMVNGQPVRFTTSEVYRFK